MIRLFILLVFLLSLSGLGKEDVPKEERDALWLYGAVDAGLGFLSTDVTGGGVTEAGKSGFAGNLKLLLSYYNKSSFVLDFGGGVYFSRMAGDRASGQTITIENFDGLTEISWRLLLGSGWQLGPVINAVFGADLSYKPTLAPVVTGEGEKKLIFLGGLHLVYELPTQLPLRFGLRVATDFDIPDRQIFFAQAMFQIGFVDFLEPGPEPEPEPPPPPPPPKPQVAIDLFNVSLVKIRFKFDSDELRPRSAVFVEKLGTFLSKYNKRYKGVLIEGHTDQIGTAAYNQDLSKRRAATVGRIFEAEGVPARKLIVRGFGSTRPLVTERSDAARAKNRRVRIRMLGVVEKKKFQRTVKKLIRRIYKPEQ